jgi:hypothetical protein
VRELEGELSALLPGLLTTGARVVVESDRRAPAELALEVTAQRRYGDTTITIHDFPAESEAEDRAEPEDVE